MSGEITLEMDAPKDMYTMSDKRVGHFIQAHEWAVIKRGNGSELKEWMIGLGLGGFGFLQNLYNVCCWIYARATSDVNSNVAVWDVLATIILFALFAAALSLRFVHKKEKGEFDQAVADIESREPKPFAGT